MDRTILRSALLGAALLGAAGCAGQPPAVARTAPATPLVPAAAPAAAAPVEHGTASWYGEWHHGRLTASGEPFDMNQLTAAHPTLPLGSRLRVTNLENDRSVTVTVNDRGPYSGDRVIDLSAAAAKVLGMREQGLAEVRIEVVAAGAVAGR